MTESSLRKPEDRFVEAVGTDACDAIVYLGEHAVIHDGSRGSIPLGNADQNVSKLA